MEGKHEMPDGEMMKDSEMAPAACVKAGKCMMADLMKKMST